jgi:Uma2 family endonuclease
MTPQKQAEREISPSTNVQTNENPLVGMSLDDYLEALAENANPFELLDGERVDKLPQVWRHSWLIRYLFRLLDAFVTQHQLGQVFQETTYAQNVGTGWVTGSRIPDLMFFPEGRVEAFQKSLLGSKQDVPFFVAPMLTIEVISSSDRMSVLNKKVKTDKANGVRLIWLIDEANQEVTEHYDDSIKILGIGDMLDGKDILSNFSLSIQTLFSQ